MEFKVNVQQLGKIEAAQLQVKPLTVIAGENGCGKSFATKSLYSLLGALNTDHVSLLIARTLRNVLRCAHEYKEVLRYPSAVDKEFLAHLFEDMIPALEALLMRAHEADLQSQSQLEEKGESSLQDINDQLSAYIQARSGVKKMHKPLKILADIQQSLADTQKTLQDHRETIRDGIASSLQDNLKKNFQISDLKSILNNQGEGSAAISIDSIGNMEINRQGELGFSFNTQGVDEIQRLDHIIFVDSPVYLKIRKGLEKRGLGVPSWLGGGRYLKGYPQYIDDLYRYLDSEFIDTPAFSELSEELQNILEGKLVVGKAGEIDYQAQSGTRIPLALTAMGVSNIGLIELLIRNNIIKPGSFLIIDEPEAHLHPKWQVVLMDVLYKIAQAGANVIVATHSIDMVKKVEVLLKQEDQAEDLIALNAMPFNEADLQKTAQEKVEHILQQLSAPFYEMYMDNL